MSFSININNMVLKMLKYSFGMSVRSDIVWFWRRMEVKIMEKKLMEKKVMEEDRNQVANVT